MQLTELNNRSRFYVAQIWQLPVAYLAGAGLVLAGLKDTGLTIGFAAAGVLGLLLLWHLIGMENGRSRAVRNLQRLEAELKLTQTAEDRPGYTLPLIIAIAVASLGLTIAAIVRSCAQ